MADFHLPDDIICMILLRLPAKTLWRFRILSKEWNKTIIRNRAFAKENMLMHSGNNTSTSNVLLICTTAGYSYRCVIESNFDREVRRVMNVKVDLPFKKYIDATSKNNHWCGLSSSCHGLLCLIYHCNDRAILFVWNPLTNYYKEVPWPEEHVTEQDAKGAFVGFGYDHILNDYKIVVSVYIEKLRLTQVRVMTLSTNVWRSVDAAPWQHLFKDKCLDSKPLFDWRYLYLCWLGVDKRNNCHVLMKFDLVEEKLTVIYIRGRDINYPGHASKLGQYKGLPFYYIYQTGSIPMDRSYGKLSVYTPGPKVAGQKRRWQKIINEHDVPAPTIGTTLAEPIGFVTDEDMLLMSVDNGRGLAAYFRNKNELVELNLSEQIEQNVQDVCYLAMESLISPC